jgi:hypothetical protein
MKRVASSGESVASAQEMICDTYEAACSPLPPDQLIAISRRVLDGGSAAAGVRYPDSTADNSGWIVFAPELEEDMSEFVGLHASHLGETHPHIARYLGLPVGWRFALAPGSELAWFDPDVASAAE